MRRTIIPAFALALGLAAGAREAAAVSMVANGGFESGVLSPWTAANGVEIDTAFPHAGRFDASFSTVSSVPATLTQDIATVPGAAYRLSFFVLDEAASALDTFTVTFGGFITTITGDAAFDPAQAGSYASVTLLLPGAAVTGGITRLGFAAVNGNAAFNLDDVALTPAVQDIPEPGSMIAAWVMLLIGADVTRRHQRRV